MKTKTVLTVLISGLVLLSIVSFTSCINSRGNDNNTNNTEIDLVNNEEQKEQAFNQIINNEELLNEFMIRMMDESQSLHWMMENQEFMNHMFMNDNLDYIMDHNEGMGNHIMQNMIDIFNRDSSMYEQWNNMMDEHMMGHGRHMR